MDVSVRRGRYNLHVQEYPGDEPAIVLMHGFPDNLHLYDRLIPYLAPPRHVIRFDFLGWGDSDKPLSYEYTTNNQMLDLDTVVRQRGLRQIVLVAHDASGPPAIDWALEHPGQVAALILLNTYYCNMPTLKPPEAIWLFSTPIVRSVARPVSRLFNSWLFRKMYWWQVGKFFRDEDVRKEFLPILFKQFDAKPSTQPAFFGLNEDLPPTIRHGSKMVPKLKEFRRPVRIIFGAADPYLNKGVAQSFHELFPTSDLFLLAGARHFVQMDEPAQVASLILSAPIANAN